jgi:pilus assembly protein CpaC
MKHVVVRGFLLAGLVLASLSVSETARGARSYETTVRLIAGKADTVELESAVADVLVANPAVADVGTLRSNRLYIVGRTVGDTNVLAYDETGNQLADITIQVRMDDKSLQDSLKNFFPDEKISVNTVQSNVILSGTVSSPAVSGQVRDLATRFLAGTSQTVVDLMKVRGDQQVMLKVKMIEANRSVLRDLGVQTSLGRPEGRLDLVGSDLGRANASPFATGTLTLGRSLGYLETRLRAYETNGLVNTLAEPNLTAINGETAGFLAGGEFPVPSSQDENGLVSFDFKQFGVSLNFTPTVLSKDRIALHLSTEVSAKDDTGGVTIEGLVSIPGITVRKAETTVEVGSGSTLMIAGLINSATVDTLTGMPGVEKLPIIGELFKSKSFTRNESELLIIVTPYLVDSYAEPEAVAVNNPGPVHLSDLGPAPVKPASIETYPKSSALNLSPAEKAAQAQPAPAVMPAQPAPAVVKAPEAKPAPAKVALAKPASPAMKPLSQRLVGNLRKAYGTHTMDKVGTEAGFGYIVD